MIRVYDIFKEVDIPECIDIMISLHRIHYHQPGYILNSTLLRQKYSRIVDILTEDITHNGKEDILHISLDSKTDTYSLINEDIIVYPC